MTDAARWPNPPPEIKLTSQDLHIWSGILDISASQKERFWRLLSPKEQVRAQRFYFEHGKTHFVAARGMLRTLIGRYLDCSPDEVQFAYGEHGKPQLAYPRLSKTFQFNVSHAQGVALLAFCWGADVGVDVEQIRPLSNAHKIAARFFSDLENKQFKTVPDQQISNAFFNCWTRKEAFIKAVGDGLSYPLNQFDVTLLPAEPARFIRIRNSETEAARWSLYTLSPMRNYVGAVAVPGRDWRLSCWRWAEL